MWTKYFWKSLTAFAIERRDTDDKNLSYFILQSVIWITFEDQDLKERYSGAPAANFMVA